MTDSFILVLMKIHSKIDLLHVFLQVLSFCLIHIYLRKEKFKVFRTLSYWIFVNLFFKFLYSVYFSFTPDEGIHENSIFQFTQAILELLIFSYLYLFQLKFSKWTTLILKILVSISLISLVIDLFNTQINVLDYIFYSEIFQQILVILMTVIYILESYSNNEKLHRSNMAISVVVFVSFVVTVIYSLILNFMMNQALKNNGAMLLLLSGIIFDVIFSLLLLSVVGFQIRSSKNLKLGKTT